MSIEPISIWNGLITFMRDVPTAFPLRGKSWSLALMAYFYHAGKESNCEVRCGDWSKRWIEQIEGTQKSFPEPYKHFTPKWNVKGLLEFDVCWLSPGFDVLVEGPDQRAPTARRIVLAYEHEDNTFTVRRGTDLRSVLDEVRKIGAVRTNLKVLSFFTSQLEAKENKNLPLLQAEIARFPEAAVLTDNWIILQLCRFIEPGTRGRLTNGGIPQVFVRGMVLKGDGSSPVILGETVLVAPEAVPRVP